MKTLTIAVDEKYVELLDRIIKNSGLYSSRSEFMKDAVRAKMLKLLELEEEVKVMRKKMQKFKKKYENIYRDTGDLTKEDKDIIARKYIKDLNQ